MTLAEQKAVVAHTSEAFSDTESNVVIEAAKAVLKDSEARGGGVQMLGVDKIYPGSTVKALDDFNLETIRAKWWCCWAAPAAANPPRALPGRTGRHSGRTHPRRRPGRDRRARQQA